MVNMKKVLQFLICFVVILVIPVMVFAEEFESEIFPISNLLEKYDFGDSYIMNFGVTKYSNMHSTGSPGLSFVGSYINDYPEDIEVYITINIYDKDKIFLDRISKLIKVSSGNSSLYNVDIYQKDVNYNIDAIKYYSISADFVTDIELIDKVKQDYYYLENYRIKVNVNENNIYNVEETFLAVFKNNVLPIKKELPLRLRYIRGDNTKVNKRILISNIDIKDYYELNIDNGMRIFEIGKLDKVNTKKNYVIKYDYDVGKDTLNSKDEFVFYLSNSFEQKISGLEFEIKMPKEFDESNIRFVDNNGILIDNVKYEVKDNIISGKIEGDINPNTYYAINIILKNNYFKECNYNINVYTILSFILPVIYMIVAFVILIVSIIVYKNKKYNGDICFNEEINSLELGFLYKGEVKDKDIASLVFWLANKGYITISKTKKDYKIEYVKKYRGNDRVEKTFIEELFKEKKVLSKNEIIKSFSDIREKICLYLDDSKRKKKIFIRPSLNYKIVFMLMIINIFIINVISLLIEYKPDVILFNIIVSGIGYVIMFINLFNDKKPLEKLLYILVSLILIVIPIVLTSYSAFLQSNLFIISYVLGIFSMLVIAIISSCLSNRTRYGKKMLYKIKAYQELLKNCDDEFINNELKNNKNLLYDVLAYSFVLGISEEWIEKFNDKDIEGPSWYNTQKFKLQEFYEDMKNIYSDVFLALKNNVNR